MNRLEEKYKKEVVPSLMEKYNYKTVMLVPKIEKIFAKSETAASRFFEFASASPTPILTTIFSI